MKAKYTLFLRLIGSLFALALLAAPSLGVALTVTQVSVVVGGAVYCDTGLVQPVACANPIWNLGSGVVLGANQTLILTQTGVIATPPRPSDHGGENFDTSDRGGTADGSLLACSTPGGTPCDTQIFINGLQVSSDSHLNSDINSNPLPAFNNEPTSNTSTQAATLFQEATPWSLAPNFTGLGFALELGYADNIHGGAVCNGEGGSCFPQLVWDITNENPGTPGNGAATYFLGGGLVGPIGNCITQGYGIGTVHPNTDGATPPNVVGCYDGGALRITAPPAANITTVTQGGWGAPPHGNNPGAVLKAYFTSHPGYAPKIGDITNACGGFVDTFNTANAIEVFLPAGGKPGVLSASATNPTSTSAGVFAGQVLALTLNTQVLPSGGSLLNFVITAGPATGKTVAVLLADADKALGGCGLPSYVTSISELSDAVDSINNLFD